MHDCVLDSSPDLDRRSYGRRYGKVVVRTMDGMMDAWGRRAAIAVTPAEMEATVGMDGAVSHRGDCG